MGYASRHSQDQGKISKLELPVDFNINLTDDGAPLCVGWCGQIAKCEEEKDGEGPFFSITSQYHKEAHCLRYSGSSTFALLLLRLFCHLKPKPRAALATRCLRPPRRAFLNARSVL